METVAKRHQFVVDLAGDTVHTYFAVELKSHIEHGRVVGERQQFALWRKHHYLGGKKI